MKTLLSLVVLFGALGIAHGYLLVEDSFNYPNGCVTAVSGGLWVAHSQPGNGCVAVSGGKLKVDFWNSEDVSIALPGAPYNTANNQSVTSLYSSFTLIGERLPNEPWGTYFAHFKDSGPIFFRCRVWAMTNGAAPGYFRLAISCTNSTGSNATVYPLDLAINTPYTIITRLDLATADSALWINPSAETDFAALNYPPNPCSPIGIAAYAFRQVHHESGTMLIGNLKIGTAFSDLIGNSTPPRISEIPPQTTAKNTPTAPIPFTVQSDRSAAGSLFTSAISSNAAVVPNDPAHLILSGSGSNRFLTIVPGTNAQGSATIAVSVSDGNHTTPTAFSITVGAPTISTIPDQITAINTPLLNIPFAVSDPDSDTLSLSVSVSNLGLFPTGNVVLGGSGPNRTVSLYPLNNQTGVAAVTIAVSDGFHTNQTTFNVAVSPRLGLLFSDTFSYSNAPAYSNSLTAVPGSLWTHASGKPNQIKLGNNAVNLCYSNTECAGAYLSGGPYQPSNGITFYAGFAVNFSVMPFTNGNYIFLFKDSPSNTLVFRGKVFARTLNAANGFFRLGIANFENEPVDFPMDLSLNTTYQVVVAHNAGLGESALWVNPSSEQSPQVLGTDVPSPAEIGAVELRSGKGMGNLTVGPIMVGTSFQDVFTPPLPIPLVIQKSGTNVILTWSNSAFGLASGTNLPLVSTRIPGATSPYTNPITGSRRFFRLVYP